MELTLKARFDPILKPKIVLCTHSRVTHRQALRFKQVPVCESRSGKCDNLIRKVVKHCTFDYATSMPVSFTCVCVWEAVDIDQIYNQFNEEICLDWNNWYVEILSCVMLIVSDV